MLIFGYVVDYTITDTHIVIWVFSEIYTLCYIFYIYGSEMYRLYRTKLYGPVMIKLYKENNVMIEIMG